MECERIRFRVDTRQIHFLRFILEACEGLTVLSTLDAASGLVECRVPADRAGELEMVLEDMAREIFLDRAA